MILISLLKQLVGVRTKAKAEAKPADAGAYPYYDAAEAIKRLEELQKHNKQLHGSVVTGYVLPTAQATSPIDGAPVTTHCGRPCEVGVVCLARSGDPCRMIWMYSPCLRSSAHRAVQDALNQGLITWSEYDVIGKLMSTQFSQMRCYAVGEEGAS